jgi:hypothetical protein
LGLGNVRKADGCGRPLSGNGDEASKCRFPTGMLRCGWSWVARVEALAPAHRIRSGRSLSESAYFHHLIVRSRLADNPTEHMFAYTSDAMTAIARAIPWPDRVQIWPVLAAHSQRRGRRIRARETGRFWLCERRGDSNPRVTLTTTAGFQDSTILAQPRPLLAICRPRLRPLRKLGSGVPCGIYRQQAGGQHRPRGVGRMTRRPLAHDAVVPGTIMLVL